jgi:hypothetical protein
MIIIEWIRAVQGHSVTREDTAYLVLAAKYLGLHNLRVTPILHIYYANFVLESKDLHIFDPDRHFDLAFWWTCCPFSLPLAFSLFLAV